MRISFQLLIALSLLELALLGLSLQVLVLRWVLSRCTVGSGGS